MQSFRHIRSMLQKMLIASFMVVTTLPAGAAPEQPELGHRMTTITKPLPAPDFTLEDMDEIEQSFSANKGKVVLLNFWATWCPPCKREMPSMERLYQKLKDKNFTVIAVDQMEDIDTVFSFTGQLPLDPTFPILFDNKSNVSRSYNVKGLPTTYLIDKKGFIRYRAIGGREFDHANIENLINNLMDE